MNTDNPQHYQTLLIRIISLNALFVALMVSMSFIALLSYDRALWEMASKSDILKVFIQNLRFNLSICAYINIPVILFLLILLAFKPAQIMKSCVKLIKSYYLSTFIASMSLFTLFYIVRYIPRVNTLLSTGYFEKISFLYSGFDNPTFIILLVIMSILFLLTVIVFVGAIRFSFSAKEYTVEDYEKALISTLAALLFCFAFAKGKIIGHLSVQDSYVTPIMQLNEYAVPAHQKIISSIKTLDMSNIVYARKKQETIKQDIHALLSE